MSGVPEDPRTATEVATTLLAARTAKGLTYADVAEALDKPLVWMTSALLGQQPFDEETAHHLITLLDLDEGLLPQLIRVPWRGSFDPSAPPSDPTVYRLYEAIQVYGPALKELINEEFGDGIMSAIAFNVSFSRREDPHGDRVHIEFDGKFLGYSWD
jgi:cyanate lyase